MKYTTKQSRIEEITIDLEDGSVVKITRSNIMSLKTHTSVVGLAKKTINVIIELNNGITLDLKSVEKDLVNNLRQIIQV